MNVVLCVNPPPTPVTVTAYEPTGVVEEVVMRQILVNEGLPTDGLIETDELEGSPDTESLTF